MDDLPPVAEEVEWGEEEAPLVGKFTLASTVLLGPAVVVAAALRLPSSCAILDRSRTSLDGIADADALLI